MLIAFEGAEATGKSTQASLLKDALESMGHSVLATREPGGTPIGEEIRNMLSKKESDIDPLTELCLISAARCEHTKLIKKRLDEGYIVITDRFIDSSKAYQGHVKGLKLSIVNELINLSTGGLIPDITFILHIKIDTLMRRLSNSKTHNSSYDQCDRNFHEKVMNAFAEIASTKTMRMPNDIEVINNKDLQRNYVTIDGDRDKDIVHADILTHIRSYIQDKFA